MGTRADFYVREDGQMNWLGSIAWDGYPKGIDQEVLNSQNEKDYLFNLKAFFDKRKDVTLPEQGWPWPWNNSKLTDECYVYEQGVVKRMVEHDGDYKNHKTECVFYRASTYEQHYDDNGLINKEEKWKFCVPDMSEIKNVAKGRQRSGIITICVTSEGKFSVE